MHMLGCLPRQIFLPKGISSFHAFLFPLEIRLFVKILKAGVAVDYLLFTFCVSIFFYYYF
jgi:hypothetical protein